MSNRSQALRIIVKSIWEYCRMSVSGNCRYIMFTHLSYFTLPYVRRVMSDRNMLFQWADHTVKVQSLLQGFAALLPIDLDTEQLIRLGRKNGPEKSRHRPVKKANLSIVRMTLNRIRHLVLKANLHPLPITRGDMMDFYFKKAE